MTPSPNAGSLRLRRRQSSVSIPPIAIPNSTPPSPGSPSSQVALSTPSSASVPDDSISRLAPNQDVLPQFSRPNPPALSQPLGPTSPQTGALRQSEPDPDQSSSSRITNLRPNPMAPLEIPNYVMGNLPNIPSMAAPQPASSTSIRPNTSDRNAAVTQAVAPSTVQQSPNQAFASMFPLVQTQTVIASPTTTMADTITSDTASISASTAISSVTSPSSTSPLSRSASLSTSPSATSSSDRLPFIITGSVVGGFVLLGIAATIVAWILRWRARKRGNFGHSDPWSGEPVYVGDDEKDIDVDLSSPILCKDTGTSWGNLNPSMLVSTSGMGERNGSTFERVEGTAGMFKYRGTPYPRHSNTFLPQSLEPLPLPPVAHMSPFPASPFINSHQAMDYPNPFEPNQQEQQPTTGSPVAVPQTPAGFQLAVTNFTPGDLSLSNTMSTGLGNGAKIHAALASPYPSECGLTPRPDIAPPSPWAPLNIPSRRPSSKSTLEPVRPRKPLPAVPNGGGRKEDSWASSLRSNFLAALGSIGVGSTPNYENDLEKLTPAIPARTLSRRSLGVGSRRQTLSNLRATSLISAPSFYPEDEAAPAPPQRSTQLYDRVQRQLEADARPRSMNFTRTMSNGSSSGWTTDRGEERLAATVGNANAGVQAGQNVYGDSTTYGLNT